MKVLQIYNQEIDKLRKTTILTGAIAQETYLLLEANLLLTDDVRDKFCQLYKTHDQRGVKFADSDENAHNDSDVSVVQHPNDFVLEHDDQLTIYMSNENNELKNVDLSNGIYTKRARDPHDNNEIQPIKKQKGVVRSIISEANDAGLNSTQVLAVHDYEGLDSTFSVKPLKNPALQPLKETNANVHKDFVVPRPITKPIYKVKTTLTSLQREKENKRTPSKIRKSPRRSPANAVIKSKFKIE